jgi:hypothetical protein
LAEQKILIRALLSELKREGVALATDFAIGYNSLLAISKNKFVKYGRKMTLYFFPVYNPNDDLVLEIKKHCKTSYIDIR